jgi:hypothetical protein
MTSLKVLPKGLFNKLDWIKRRSTARRSIRGKTNPTENELTPVYHDPTARSDLLDPTATDGRAANHTPVDPPLSQGLRSATEATPDIPITNKELAALHDEDYFVDQTVSQSTFSDSIKTDNEDADPGRAVSDHVARPNSPDEPDQLSKSSAVPFFMRSRAAKTRALRANMEQKSTLKGVRPTSIRAKYSSDISVSKSRGTRAMLSSAASVSKTHRREMKMRADGLLGRKKVLEDSLFRKRKRMSKQHSNALETSIARNEKEVRGIDKLVEKMLYEALGSVSETDEDEDEEAMVEESE